MLGLFAAFSAGVSSYAVRATVLLVLAALGGLLLNLGYQEKRKLLPTPVRYVHMAIAITSFSLPTVTAVKVAQLA